VRPISSPPAAASTVPVALASEHFTVSSSAALDRTAVRALAHFLEQHCARVIADLQATTVGTIHVDIQSNSDFDAKWKTLIDRCAQRSGEYQIYDIGYRLAEYIVKTWG
jgi:hypothetical protein